MLSPEIIPLMAGAVAIVALLYSSVGHAGASGYLAVLALFGLAPSVIKPTALILNIAVASLGAFQFCRAGYFHWRLFWPFALLSIPCAFLGGHANLPTHFFKVLVGAVLLFSAARLLVKPPEETEPCPPRLPARIGAGAGLGLLAGLTGPGGGIFLTCRCCSCTGRGRKTWPPCRRCSSSSTLWQALREISAARNHCRA